jgi:hypothetical protein
MPRRSVSDLLGGQMGRSEFEGSPGDGSFGGISDGMPAGAVGTARIDEGPKLERTAQPATSQPGKGRAPEPPAPSTVRVTLLMPQDKFDGWYAARPAWLEVEEFKVLNDDEQTQHPSS